MGCDIHAFIDWTELGSYLGIAAEVHLPRDYDLFEIMADVRTRDDIAPLFRPRGLPTPLSRELAGAFAKWEDAHSESWLTAAELAAVADAYQIDPRRSDITLALLRATVDFMRVLGEISPPRLVFWFDG